MTADELPVEGGVGLVLRAAREDLNLHRSDVETDELSQHYIAKLETGERTSEEALQRYANVLSVDLDTVRQLASWLLQDEDRRTAIEEADSRSKGAIVKRLLGTRLEELGATEPPTSVASDVERHHLTELIDDLPAEAVSTLWRVATTREEHWREDPVTEAIRLRRLHRLPVEVGDVDELVSGLTATVHDVRPWQLVGVSPNAVRHLGHDRYEVDGRAETTPSLSGAVRVTRRRDGAVLIDARDVHHQLTADPVPAVEDSLQARRATLPWTLPVQAFLDTRILIWPDDSLTAESLDDKLGTSDRETAPTTTTGRLWNGFHAHWDHEILGDAPVEVGVGEAFDTTSASFDSAKGVAVITAFNPQSVEAPDASNRMALRGLARTLASECDNVFAAEGRGKPQPPDGSVWTEPSLAATGVDRDVAIEIAAGLGQTAIFWIEEGGTSLVMCFDPEHPYPSRSRTADS